MTTKINYQALREAAEAIETVATPQKLLAFRMKVTPQVVLALLDERERNQQYIKRRDQENEDIALTVGKLRVELEAAKSKLNEQREYYEGVIADGSKRIAELEAREVVLPRAHDVHPLGPQSAKIFCEFHRSIVNRCADEIRKVGVKVSIKRN
ncbi:ead/Ea22-like family protein [Salmonella enterica]|nr:ead/Ea22-like family protein [Salmonella enterica]ELK6528050.1 ead/Ea22-like family protein [Escherichia coli]ELK6737280.1 ead/Ea22-like family protein [Escherichia coli]